MQKLGLVLGVIVLAVSVALLLWGIWPAARTQFILPITPSEMSLPTPTSFFLDSSIQFII
jgi:hypothetical protein